MCVLDMRASKAKAATFLVVQWLGLCAFTVFTAGGMGLIPGWGTKIPHATCFGQKKRKSQGSQITLTLGGHILTVRNERLLWTVNPRMPLPQEILKQRPLSSDLKSSPECGPKSVLTHSGSQVSHMNNNTSICVLVERWMECVQRSCPGLLCFSSLTLNPFLKKFSPVSIADLLCGLEPASGPLWAYFHIWNIRRLGKRVSNIQWFSLEDAHHLLQLNASDKSEEREALVTDDPLFHIFCLLPLPSPSYSQELAALARLPNLFLWQRVTNNSDADKDFNPRTAGPVASSSLPHQTEWTTDKFFGIKLLTCS